MLNYRDQVNWPDGFGEQQSPIAITSAELTPEAQPLPIEPATDLALAIEQNDGTTIKVLGSGVTKFSDRAFDFQQAHFHVPAEHQIDGHQAAMEIHLVHQNDIGQLAVIAVFVELGAADKQLQAIIEDFDADNQVLSTGLLNAWLPAAPSGYHYLGSLTTPPLTEGVEWFVVDNANLTLSQEQLDWWQAHFPANNRALQLQNGRAIEWYTN